MKALSMPFRIGTTGSIEMTQDYRHIVQYQVIDTLMTNRGERVMRPTYGCDFQNSLFEPSDLLVRQDLAGQIRDKLTLLCPRAIVSKVKVEPLYNMPNIVEVQVTYRTSAYDSDVTVTQQVEVAANG